MQENKFGLGRKEKQGKFWNMEHFLSWAVLAEWTSVWVSIASKSLRSTEKFLKAQNKLGTMIAKLGTVEND